jgi:hypothetical protein
MGRGQLESSVALDGLVDISHGVPRAARERVDHRVVV